MQEQTRLALTRLPHHHVTVVPVVYLGHVILVFFRYVLVHGVGHAYIHIMS